MSIFVPCQQPRNRIYRFQLHHRGQAFTGGLKPFLAYFSFKVWYQDMQISQIKHYKVDQERRTDVCLFLLIGWIIQQCHSASFSLSWNESQLHQMQTIYVKYILNNILNEFIIFIQYERQTFLYFLCDYAHSAPEISSVCIKHTL